MDSRPSLLLSKPTKRAGLLDNRLHSIREFNISTKSNAFPGSLASALQVGFRTALSPQGHPLLYHSNNHQLIFELDTCKLVFTRASHEKYPDIFDHSWGCISPIFHNVVPENKKPLSFSFVSIHDGDQSFEAVYKHQLKQTRFLFSMDDVHGFEDDADVFNRTLSKPVLIANLHTEESFYEIFPRNDDDSPMNNGFNYDSEHIQIHDVPTAVQTKNTKISGFKKFLSRLGTKSEKKGRGKVGRMILSYRHQNYGEGRITYDDWLCVEKTVRNIADLYGWKHVRFWSDARLRKFKRMYMQERNISSNDQDQPWASLGIEPYMYGPVIILSCSEKPSLVDRFWLTIERRTGIGFNGTWLVDDAGDLFFYKLYEDEDVDNYVLGMITNISSSQELSWPKDRDDLLQTYWKDLDVSNAKKATHLLKSVRTFRSRQDIIGEEELSEFRIAPRGETIQWCGDLEALIDPPSFQSVFGEVGILSEKYTVKAIDLGREIGDVKCVVLVFTINTKDIVGAEDIGSRNPSSGLNLLWVSKKVFLDKDTGEIRARSVPRLVDDDFYDSILELDHCNELDVNEHSSFQLNTNI